jgi:hypothetical protein
MDASSDVVLADLELGQVGRDLWETALPHLARALAGDESGLLSSVEGAARGAGLCQSVPVTALLEAFTDGSRQVRGRIVAAGEPGAEAATRRLLAVEHVALTRIAAGYASGLEETITRLRHVAEESSPVDADTGAIKPSGLGERLSLEVERCQRMDLPLGLLELALGPGEAADSEALPGHAMLHDVGECLRENLRRYDSVGLTGEGEFLLVLPDISRRGLAGAAERLRRELGRCAGPKLVPSLVFALAHYDFVDVNATEMLDGLRRSMQEARSANQPIAWA